MFTQPCSPSLPNPDLSHTPTLISVSPQLQYQLINTQHWWGSDGQCLLLSLGLMGARPYNTIHHVSNHLYSISGPIQRLPWLRKAAAPELYCRLEAKLGEHSFNFQTGSLGKFPGKRKRPSDYRRDQRRRTLPGREMATPGNHGAVSVSPRVPVRAQTGHPASSLLHTKEVYPGQSIYFLLQIYLSWTELGVLSLNKDWVSEHQPPLFPI